MVFVSSKSRAADSETGMTGRDFELCASILCHDAQAIYLEHVNPAMFSIRETAVNVIIELAEAYDATAEVIVHAIALIDRLIAKENFNSSDLDSSRRIGKAAIGSYMIAVKLREVIHPSVQDIAMLTSCTYDEIRSAEEDVLLALDWNVAATTGQYFLALRWKPFCCLFVVC